MKFIIFINVLIICAVLSSVQPPSICQKRMDAWCNDHSHCANYPNYAPFFARFDLNKDNSTKKWRCYPKSVLSPDTSHYVHNVSRKEDHICTRQDELQAILTSCKANIVITTVFKGGTEGCVMYRTPSLLRITNGTLLAFTQCRQKTRSDQSPQAIHLKLSHDDGNTWSQTRILPFAADLDFSFQHRAQTVYDKSTGAIFLFDDARTVGSKKKCIIQIWKTLDLGISWHSVVNLTDIEKNVTGSGLATGIQLPNGKMIVCHRAGCNGNNAGGLGAHALWSEDHGATWQAGERLANGTNECQLALLSNGSLLINTRSGSMNRLVATSDDEGRSWSPVHVDPTLSGSSKCEASLLSLGNGTIFFSHPKTSDRTHLVIRISNDDGNTWPESDSIDVWSGPSAYSSLGTTGDGSIAVLWEKDGSDLGFAKIHYLSH